MTDNAHPDDVVRVGSTVFFAADDGIHGDELRVFDAADDSLRMIADVAPGDDEFEPRPLASSLDYDPGALVGDEVIAKLSDAGSICVYPFTDTDLTIDVIGYVRAS